MLKEYNVIIYSGKKIAYPNSYKVNYEDKIEFDYYYCDDSQKTIEDLKEYIYEITNYSKCPCRLILCKDNSDKNNNTLNNHLNYSFAKKNPELIILDSKDEIILSKADSNGIIYFIELNTICKCNYKNKKNELCKTKMNIINSYENNIKNLKKEIDLNTQKIKQLKNDLELSKINEQKNKKELQYEKDNKKRMDEEIKKLKEKISKGQEDLEKKENIIENMKTENKKLKKEFESDIQKNEEIKILKINYEESQQKVNQLKQEIAELTQKVNDLNDLIEKKNDEIRKINSNEKKQKEESNILKNQINERSEIIEKLKNDINNSKKNIDDIILEKQKIEKDNLIIKEKEKNFNEQIKELEIRNDKLKKEITNCKREIAELTLAINRDAGTISQFKELGILTNITINNSNIQIDPKTNQFKANNSIQNDGRFDINFYDIIINIKSVKDIPIGWEIKMTPEGEKNFMKYKKKELIKIGVIGNSNKGKSFILGRLSKIPLLSGTDIKTEGLSVKYPELKEFKNRTIVLLDSAGLETPVLKDEKDVKKEDDDEDNEETEDNENEKKEKIENSNNNENKDNIKISNNKETDENENGKKSEDKANDLKFKEKSREKLITELFLQNYIIKNSDILLLVVGNLTYSEQKLINRIKTEIQKLKMNRPLYIIHNLKTFYKKEQVEKYIEETLKKSLTFDLKKGHNTSSAIKSENGIYFYEKNSEPKIFHLIFANEGSEAGNYYNNFTLEFIERAYQGVTDLTPFNVIQTIKERFIELSKDIIVKTNENPKFRKDDIIDDEEILKNRIIKLKTPQEIVLKRCLIDELGFSNLKGNGFEPNYNYFKKDDNKIEVRVEAPGNSKINSIIEYSGEYTFIRLSGEKKFDKEPKTNSDNIYNTREFGNFNLDIPLKTEDYNIKNVKPIIKDKKGVIMIEYECEQKAEKYDYSGNEEDDI